MTTTCPSCGGAVERTVGEATRTMAPAFARSADDLYQQLVSVALLACTACEWCAEEARVRMTPARPRG